MVNNSKDISRKEVKNWFYSLQNTICDGLLSVEKEFYKNFNGSFEKKKWIRKDEIHEIEDGGGGITAKLYGNVFEKGGVNVSEVFGNFNETMKKEIPGASDDPRFWASGISIVIHPKNPHVPIIHMNTRRIETSKSWFGGGIDLTPVYSYEDDTNYFHKELKDTCDSYDKDYYKKFKERCDEYFLIKHRNEPRGVGGIFYDYLNTGNIDNDFSFTKSVGETFLKSYLPIVRKNMNKPYSEEDILNQSIKRGRYVEFNLVYDRGTRFGLLTNGNIDAILMSMPPIAKWK